MALCLYIFLGWVMISLWRNLNYQQEIISTRQAPSIGLRVDYQDTVQVYQFNKPVIIIGRDPDCECTLASSKVSVHHARLSFHQNQWWVEDLDSTNGSFLNEEPIFESAVVVDGDHLLCGDVTMTIIVNNRMAESLVKSGSDESEASPNKSCEELKDETS